MWWEIGFFDKKQEICQKQLQKLYNKSSKKIIILTIANNRETTTLFVVISIFLYKIKLKHFNKNCDSKKILSLISFANEMS